jgi:hypothetical protein
MLWGALEHARVALHNDFEVSSETLDSTHTLCLDLRRTFDLRIDQVKLVRAHGECLGIRRR